MSWKLFPPATLKFFLKFDPDSGVLYPNLEETVTARLVIMCTTVINITVPFALCNGTKWIKPELHIHIKVALDSALSSKLDPDELELLIPPIGDGSYGTVYRGHWRGQEVAVKVLKQQDILADQDSSQGSIDSNNKVRASGKAIETGGDKKGKRVTDQRKHSHGNADELRLESMRERRSGYGDRPNFCSPPVEFVKEVKVLENLKCPQVVRFIGACFIPGRLAIVTEICEFGSIKATMKRETLSELFKTKCMLDCAKGMTFIHKSSILHRDLKPDNLLIVSMDPQSSVCCKISDMGCTRGFNRTQATQYYTTGVGTLKFMAPEILNSDKYSTAADVYSFAMTVYYVFAERDPFLSVEFENGWKWELVKTGKRPSIPPTIAYAVRSLISQCWSHDPHDRPSFHEIKAILDLHFNNINPKGHHHRRHHHHHKETT
eukprot:TRINITY_DN2005_c0_g1_i1.p1 TRINITY_DN2005_c0_g1~~TRINITY_DN2005_c0_g1_i1.p1  ORF type:complete len:433 (-),score=79.50 TRINITY_DN2005_c0_g1_i1:98-1396(-)